MSKTQLQTNGQKQKLMKVNGTSWKQPSLNLHHKTNIGTKNDAVQEMKEQAAAILLPYKKSNHRETNGEQRNSDKGGQNSHLPLLKIEAPTRPYKVPLSFPHWMTNLNQPSAVVSNSETAPCNEALHISPV